MHTFKGKMCPYYCIIMQINATANNSSFSKTNQASYYAMNEVCLMYLQKKNHNLNNNKILL